MESIYEYNSDVKYYQNKGQYLQKIKGLDLTEQRIIVNSDRNEGFNVNFPNIFVDYVMKEDNKKLEVWNNHPFKFWETQLNFAVWCASSACGVSSQHLLNNAHPLMRSVYKLHVYYHIRRILKKLQIPLPFESGFNKYDNPYSKEHFLEVCREYGVSSNEKLYRGQYFFSSPQNGALKYYDKDSMFRWIIEKGKGFTKPGLFMISESVRAYVYLILSSQSSARSSIVGNTASALTAQRAFMNNLENVTKRRVDIQQDIERYQNTLNFASSKVDYSVGQGIYMLPSDMNLNIKTGTLGYNNKILISKSGFSLGRNSSINHSLVKHYNESTKNADIVKDDKNVTKDHFTIIHDSSEKNLTLEEEKVALILCLSFGFGIWYMFS